MHHGRASGANRFLPEKIIRGQGSNPRRAISKSQAECAAARPPGRWPLSSRSRAEVHVAIAVDEKANRRVQS